MKITRSMTSKLHTVDGATAGRSATNAAGTRTWVAGPFVFTVCISTEPEQPRVTVERVGGPHRPLTRTERRRYERARDNAIRSLATMVGAALQDATATVRVR
jgi:hypothetical protein